MDLIIEIRATSPSVGFKWTIGDTTLQANYIRNFRTPTISNQFSTNSTNIGNPNLKPETGDSFDTIRFCLVKAVELLC